MTPSLSSRCDRLRRARSAAPSQVQHRRALSARYPGRVRARKFLVSDRGTRRAAPEFSLDRRRARSYCRRCRFAVAPTPDLPPGGLRNGRTSEPVTRRPCGAAVHGCRRTASAPARARRRRTKAAEGRAPRRSELRRSEDYSGPSRAPAPSSHDGSRAMPSHPTGTVARVPDDDSLLADLDAHQRAAVTEPHAPLAILAPAGSGKTRVLTRRIAFRVREGHAEARHVLAVTFTRRAAGELVDRLEALGVDARVTAGTFHALALAQLRGRAADRRQRAAPRPRPQGAGCSAPLLGATGVGRRPSRWRSPTSPTEIEWAKARLIAPDRYAAAAARRRAAPAPPRRPRSPTSTRATRPRSASGAGSTSTTCSAGCADAHRARRRVRRRAALAVPRTSSSTSSRTRRRSRPRLLRAWLGDRTDLSVVGDAAQAIYAFAGADASPLTRLRARTSRAAARSRSRTTTARTRRDRRGRRSRARSGVRRRTRRDPTRCGRPTAAAARSPRYDDDAQEAAAVADACWREFTDGVPWHRMAVLFRTNAQSSLFETAFARRGVPFRVTGAAALRERGPRCACCSTGCARPSAPRRRVRSPSTSPTSRPTPTTPDDPRRRRHERGRPRRAATIATRCSTSAATTSPPKAARGNGRGLRRVARRRDARRAAGERGVDLVTFHRAKGLEWQVVFVTGLERGLVPISWATTPGPRAEERRLLHVALSRAEDALHCSWARLRTACGAAFRARSRVRGSASSSRRSRAVPVAAVDRRARIGDALATLERHVAARNRRATPGARRVSSVSAHASLRRAHATHRRRGVRVHARAPRARSGPARPRRRRPTSSRRSRRASISAAGNDPDQVLALYTRRARARGDLVRQPALPRVHPRRADEGRRCCST